MKKSTLTITLILLCSVAGQAQSTSETLVRLSTEYKDECGDPAYESMAWSSVEGTGVKIIDGSSIIILTKNNERRRVNLVAVDASASDSAARRQLKAMVLKSRVEVLVNPSEYAAKTVTGVVYALGKDVNLELIKAGAAKYKEPKSYAVSSFTSCVYRINEHRAREARRGLWLSAAAN
jgi:endonuclease YncB( thermonuclease family)